MYQPPVRYPTQPNCPPQLVVGLTGGMGSGKSTVRQQLQQLGAATIDADKVGHSLLLPGSEVVSKLVDAFGPDILGADGGIDRPALGKIVFGDEDALHALNAITHPKILARMGHQLGDWKAGRDKPLIFGAELPQGLVQGAYPRVVVVEAAILLESGWEQFCQEVWVVYSEPDVVLERLQAKGFSENDARQRLARQMDPDTRLAKAHRVIQNNSTPKALAQAVEQTWAQLLESL